MSKNNKSNTINKKDNSKLVNTLLIIGIIFLIGSLVLMLQSNGTKNHIKEISFKDYTDISKEDKYSIIILTSPTCSHCINYKPYVNYAADEYNLDVYDIDVTNLSLEEVTVLHDNFSAIKNEYDSENNPTIPTPVTLIVRNGEEVSSVLGEISYEKLVRLLKNNGVIKD